MANSPTTQVYRVTGDAADAVGVKTEHPSYEDAVAEGNRLVDAGRWLWFKVDRIFHSAPSETGYPEGQEEGTAGAAPRPVTASDIGEALSKMSPDELDKIRAALAPPAEEEPDAKADPAV